MENSFNTGTVETLKKGETLLVNARKVKGGKLHLEFAEIINFNNKGENVLSILNKSDDRFSSNARRAWITAEQSDATESFGVSFGDDADWYAAERGEMLELNILNPVINETRCRLVINETVEPTEWQTENLETAAKRKGKGGDFITHNGDYIFSNTDIILSSRGTDNMHVFLEADSTVVKRDVSERVSIGSMI